MTEPSLSTTIKLKRLAAISLFVGCASTGEVDKSDGRQGFAACSVEWPTRHVFGSLTPASGTFANQADLPFDVVIENGAATVEGSPSGSSTWTLSVPGFLPSTLDWDQDGCDGIRLRPAAALRVEIQGAGADNSVMVESSCGEPVFFGLGRTGTLFVPPDIECELRAIQLLSENPVTTLVIAVGELDETSAVSLRFPPGAKGGIGLYFEPHPIGLLVSRVETSGPAARAGLEHGDLIVEINGSPAGGVGIGGALAMLTGPPGSDVILAVLTRRGTQRVTLVREPLVETTSEADFGVSVSLSSGRPILVEIGPGAPILTIGAVIGDGLVSIDGEPVYGKSLEELRLAMTGAKGSTAMVVVEGESGRRQGTVTRGMYSTGI